MKGPSAATQVLAVGYDDASQTFLRPQLVGAGLGHGRPISRCRTRTSSSQVWQATLWTIRIVGA